MCPNCQKPFRLPPSAHRAMALNLTCPACMSYVDVGESGDGERGEVGRVSLAGVQTPGRQDQAGFSSLGVKAVKVRVPWGMVYEFSDIQTLQSYMQTGKVTPDDHISLDGQKWVAIGPRTDLVENLRRAYRYDRHGNPLQSFTEPPAPRTSPEADASPPGRPRPAARQRSEAGSLAAAKLGQRRDKVLLCLAGGLFVVLALLFLLTRI